MKLQIQNMVSLRCKILVKNELEKLNLSYNYLELGEVNLKNAITPSQRIELKSRLNLSGLKLMEDKTSILVAKITAIILEMINFSDGYSNLNFSTFLCNKMKEDYPKMAAIFCQTKGITIEHFIIINKIEKIKELITFNEISLTEISHKMNYSSVAHLSRQFKQITGLTPTLFKAILVNN